MKRIKRLFVVGLLRISVSSLLGEVGADYKIAPSDLIIINVVGEKDLSLIEKRVTSNGTITFPFLNEVDVKDKTPAEVESQIRDALIERDYFKDPQIVVTVKEYRKRVVTVIGEVNKPDTIEFPNEQEMNLLEAIARAGGFTKLANKSKIHITRSGKQTRFNLKDWLKTSDMDKLFKLEPGDVIFVPESLF